MTEGYIKFNCTWQQGEIEIQNEIFTQLQSARAELFSLGLIGMYPDGIGFGNISARNEERGSFIISGSATGGLTQLKTSDYALVTNFSIAENTVFCTGLTKASAESLTHSAVYQSLPEVGAVVHVHCGWLWEAILNNYPTTSSEIEYGTPEMAYTIGKLAFEIKDYNEKIIVMGGHREGIIAFGHNMAEATAQIINIYNRYKND